MPTFMKINAAVTGYRLYMKTVYVHILGIMPITANHSNVVM